MNSPPPTSTTAKRGGRKKQHETASAAAGAVAQGDDEDDTRDFSVVKNEGDEDTIVVMAHVKDKIIPVHCGFGTQQVVWLGHVAVARYDGDNNQGWRELGVPTKIIKDAKEELHMSDLIYDVLQNHSHVYIATSLG